MSHRVSLVLTGALAVAACADDGAEPCVEVDCVPTVSVELTTREPGEYAATLTLTLEGDPSPCTLVLPTPDPETVDASLDCAYRGVSVIGLLPDEPLAVGYPGNVQNVALRVTRVGQVVAEESFVPQYVDPPPDAPACPAQCRKAMHVVGAR